MSYETKTYQALRKECVERGLNGNGTREELAARLEAADASQRAETSQNDTSVTIGTKAAPESSYEAKETPTEARRIERVWKADQKKMKEHLEAQPKVSIMIPLNAGEKPENGQKVPFTVNLNGYRQEYPRGEFITVPKQIAEMIQERLESEGKIGRQWRIDADAERANALQ